MIRGLRALRSADRARPGFRELFPRSNALASAVAARIEDPSWQLELAKRVAEGAFVDVAEPRRASPELAVRRALLAARFPASVAAAGAAWFAAVARCALLDGPRAPIPPGAVTVAVYGELSNRTRHVLTTARDAGRPVVVIVVGRPRTPLPDLRKELDGLGLGGATLVRPVSPTAVGRALPAYLAAARRGARATRAAGFVPGWRDELAMAFRVFEGLTAAAWWTDEGGWDVDLVVYGHTGLADVTPLEAAQQARGATTVHWLHGLTGGWNFAGRSSVALCRCEADARAHAALPGYGRSVAPPAGPPPPRARGGHGWLLLTNFAHPTNPFAGHGALDLERETLAAFVAAAREAGAPATWRPHPLFWSLPSDDVAPILADARAAGIKVSGAADRMPPLAGFALVACTPSTTAVEALRAGVLPVLLSPAPLQPETAYASLPLAARDAAGLGAAAAVLGDDTAADAAFARAWAEVGPSPGALRWDELAALVRP